jgi:hypothetical protein
MASKESAVRPKKFGGKEMNPLTLSIALSFLLSGAPQRFLPHQPSAFAVRRVTYKRYTNVRFAYAINYPVGVLIPQGESDNSDGQIFRSADGHAEMRVFGRNNVFNDTLRSAFDKAVAGEDSAGRVVTYKLLKGDFYVVSGHQNGKIFYEKTMLKGDVFKTFMIEYDEAERAKYDPITARIANSFASVQGGVQ